MSFYGLLILFFLLMNHISFCGSIGLSNLGDFLFCSRTVSLCSQSYPYLQSSCLSLLSSEITSMCHHILFFFFFNKKRNNNNFKIPKTKLCSWAWWFIPGITALGRLKQSQGQPRLFSKTLSRSINLESHLEKGDKS